MISLGMVGQSTNSSKSGKFDIDQWKEYVTSVMLVKNHYFDELSDWEREFFKSCYSKLGRLSDKQKEHLDKICNKYFKKV